MTFNLLELIIFGTNIAIIAILAINNVRLYVSNKKVVTQIVQLTLDKISLENAMDKLTQEIELLNLKETDGFVKFLSESRESAYEYIEEVQSSIRQLANAMNVGEENSIELAYKELIKHMPKEQPND